MAEAQRYPKRLIEVDLPIRKISEHARREKPISHGHISTLHIWWARRPLAACRAVTLAALLPDPVDDACPKAFIDGARTSLEDLRNTIGGPPIPPKEPAALRAALLQFIANFADWRNSTQKDYLHTARRLIGCARSAFGAHDGPVVLDPFSGGGAIPLEAARCGASVLAADLNPIAVLQGRVLTEFAPRITAEFNERFVEMGARVEQLAKSYLGDGVNDGSTFGWFVARTVLCEGPGCGVRVPLIRGFALSNSRGIYLDWRKSKSGACEVENDPSDGVARPIIDVVPKKPSSRASASGGSTVCPVCQFTTKQARVAAQASDRGFGYRLIAVGEFDGGKSKTYRVPTRPEEEAYARGDGRPMPAGLTRALDVPINEKRPSAAGRGMSAVTRYGYRSYRSLFGDRQIVVLGAFQRAVAEVVKTVPEPERELLAILLLFAVDRLATFQNQFCRWAPKGEHPVPPFGKNGFPMIWDFSVMNPFADGPGSWAGGVRWISLILKHLAESDIAGGTVRRSPAQTQWMPDDSVDALITDPPYYDSYAYADLSDFFFPVLAAGFDQLGLAAAVDLVPGNQAPKDEELVVQPTRLVQGQPKDEAFYQRGLCDAFEAARRAVKPEGIGVVVFANKTTDGWEAVLRALLDAGWVITASWPIQTEKESRTRGEARLQSSVHIVCRPRETSDGALSSSTVGDWREVLQELPLRIHHWLPRLAAEGIVGADAIFACLGPALEIYSRYARVEKVSGERVELREYLEHVWAAVSREALATVFRDAETTGLEADARLSAMWLWTLMGPATDDSSIGQDSDGDHSDADYEESTDPGSSTFGFALEYDAARKIAQGLGARLEELEHIVEVKGGRARLLGVAERARHLFGKTEGTPTAKKAAKKKQMTLFGDLDEAAEAQGWGEVGAPKAGTTTLDRVHQAMLLFGSGRGEALKRFLVEEGVGKQTQFWKLAQSFSALYPSGSDERRWVDGVLARKKGLGFG